MLKTLIRFLFAAVLEGRVRNCDLHWINYDFHSQHREGGWGGGEGLLLWHLSFDALPLYGASLWLLPFIFTPRPTPSYASPYLLSQRIRQVPHIQKKSGQDHFVNRAISQALLRASYFLFIDNNNNYYNHNYKKILRSDWLSTVLISSLLGQLNRTVRVMLK